MQSNNYIEGEFDEVFFKEGQNVFFPQLGWCFHESFAQKYQGKDIIKAKKMMKGIFTKREKSHICRYLIAAGKIYQSS